MENFNANKKVRACSLVPYKTFLAAGMKESVFAYTANITIDGKIFYNCKVLEDFAWLVNPDKTFVLIINIKEPKIIVEEVDMTKIN